MNSKITIGRSSENNIVIADNRISRQQAIVEVVNKKYYISNTGSNKTIINGNSIPNDVKVPIKKGDNILIGGLVPLDWKQINKREHKPNNGTSVSLNSKYILTMVLLLLAIGGIYYAAKNIDFVSNNETDRDNEEFETINFEKINEIYEPSVVLIYHEFFFKIDRNNKPSIYITLEDGSLTAVTEADKVDSKPITITGTGFFVSENGKIITNKHVVEPWKSEEEIVSIIKDSELYRYLLFKESVGDEVSIPTVTGETLKIGVASNRQQLDVENMERSFKGCKLIRVANDENIDLALLKTSNGQLLEGSTYIPSDKIINTDTIIRKGSEACIIGFPKGLSVAMTQNDGDVFIESTYNDGSISQISDQYKIQYDISTGPGASGSPVFNQYGQVIAVNFSGIPGFPGNISYGVKAKHIHSLLH